MRRTRLVALTVLASIGAAGVAGCGDVTGGDGAAPAGPSTASSPRTTPPVRPPAAATPVPGPPPSEVARPCPYADPEAVAGTVGQRISRTTVVPTRPHVGCRYYRADGEQAVDIAVSVERSPAAAQTRVVRMGGRAANPVDGVGDGGVVTITDRGADLAVSRGATVVAVRINQRVSLEAVEIAKLVLAKL